MQAIKARRGYSLIFNGKVGQILQKEGREYYRRPPGVRAIIPTKQGMIIQREKRAYLDREWDYRLPGGKVVDSLEEYLKLLHNPHSWKTILKALEDEVRQETGIIVKRRKEYHRSESSASVEHDLHYFLVTEFEKGPQDLQPGEVIEVLEVTYAELLELLLDRKFSEDRTRAVLFEYLIKEKPELFVKQLAANLAEK